MSGYVEKTLAGGEDIIHRANFNWTYSFFPTLWFSLGAAAVALMFFIQFAAEVPYEELRVGWWSAAIGGVCGF